ncbi:hypothetical protein B9G55_04970 [Saccharibacillus sp. O16]|nr:hypothetical protein B9G55_04970 [Saccharibacillus sp. O16]
MESRGKERTCQKMSNPFMQRLQDTHPEMIITDVQTEHSAQHYFVFTVNSSLVFRFARDREGAEALLLEARFLLPVVRRSVQLPIPEPVYESLDRLEPGYAFIGYKRLDGEPLWPEILETIAGTEAWEDAAQVLVRFLRQLHDVELPQMEGLEREKREGNGLPLEELDKRVREELFPNLSAGARKLAACDLQALRRGAETTGRVLIHGALGPAHLLWDAQEASVCGAVGFGCVRLGDPAIDFASLLALYGKPFYERCLSLYKDGECDQALDDRAHRYARLLPLREALYGIDVEDEETVQMSLAFYEQGIDR